MKKNEVLTQEQTDAVLKALDNAIALGPWEESNFLKVIGKNLREIREEVLSKIDPDVQERANANLHQAKQLALRKDQIKVYILLYSADGANMRSWEWILTNLPRQMISRPIYAEEDDARAIIKTKENKINEAYVAVYIEQNDILPISVDRLPVDKLGKHMLVLKDGTLNLDNVDYFVHQSGTYRYARGRLVKESLNN